MGLSMEIFKLLILSLLLPWVANAEEVTAVAQCQTPKRPPILVCETGGSFLCVNTLPGGVTKDFVILKGRLNLQSSTLGQLSVATQH